MSEPRLNLLAPQTADASQRRLLLGRSLIEQGTILPWQLFHALDRESCWDATLAEVLQARGWIDESQKLSVVGDHLSLPRADLEQHPPDPDLAGLLPPELCLRYNVLPWKRIGGVLILVTGRPDRASHLRSILPDNCQGAFLAVAPEAQVSEMIVALNRPELTLECECRVAPEFSCRTWTRRGTWQNLSLVGLALLCLALAVLYPMQLAILLSGIAILGLFTMSSLKLLAFATHLTRPFASVPPSPQPPPAILPRISVMVPLFREREIAQALIARLSRLTYPKALLDVLIVLEEKDDVTRNTIARTRLPSWMRVVTVPGGSSGLTTKPRALNYALDYGRGEIIGIWDAEDAPAPDQLDRVADAFAKAPPDVACLQGVLDYYNSRQNWLARCFTVEYATWFRLLMPGMARLGFAISRRKIAHRWVIMPLTCP